MRFRLVEQKILEDDNNTTDLHIYTDKNGKFYVFDGSKLVEVTASELGKKIREIEDIPFPGDHPEEESGKAGKGNGGTQGYAGWLDQDIEDYDDSEFEGILSDETFVNGIIDDMVDARRTERQKNDAELARRLNPNGSIVAAIKRNIKDFISNELNDLEDEQERYWADKNSFDDDTARKLPHEVEIEEEDKPLIYIYIDESGSCQGETARNLLDQCASAFDEFVDKKHPEDSKINVEWWYFGSTVSDDPKKTGGGTNWAPLKAHIKEHQPDNVIILTDADLSNQHGGEHIRIPGSLWCIFVNYKDPNMHVDFDARNYREYLFTGC